MSSSNKEIEINENNKIELMMDHLAYKVNPEGRKKMVMLETIKQKLKETTKKILKEKIYLKRRARTGNKVNYDNLGKLEEEYNGLLEEFRNCVREIQEQRELLIKGGMEVINQQSNKKKKNRKRRARRKKAAHNKSNSS